MHRGGDEKGLSVKAKERDVTHKISRGHVLGHIAINLNLPYLVASYYLITVERKAIHVTGTCGDFLCTLALNTCHALAVAGNNHLMPPYAVFFLNKSAGKSRLPSAILWPLLLCRIFRNYLVRSAVFGKTLFDIKVPVFILSVKFI
jgi:hypothetical protein